MLSFIVKDGCCGFVVFFLNCNFSFLHWLYSSINQLYFCLFFNVISLTLVLFSYSSVHSSSLCSLPPPPSPPTLHSAECLHSSHHPGTTQHAVLESQMGCEMQLLSNFPQLWSEKSRCGTPLTNSNKKISNQHFFLHTLPQYNHILLNFTVQFENLISKLSCITEWVWNKLQGK